MSKPKVNSTAPPDAPQNGAYGKGAVESHACTPAGLPTDGLAHPQIGADADQGGSVEEKPAIINDDSWSAPETAPTVNHGAASDVSSSSAIGPDAPPDPFSPQALRLSQDFASSIGVKKVVTTVPCRKPNRQEFVRVRGGEEWQLETGMFEDRFNREFNLVQRDLWAELPGEVHPICLRLAMNRQNDIFLWPVKMPGSDGRSNAWNDSALAAASLAETKWVRVAANMPGGMYDVFEAAGELTEPVWPELSFTEILRLCFKDRFIQSVDHPAVRALRGLA